MQGVMTPFKEVDRSIKQSDGEQEVTAKEIVEHLALSNWKIEAGPPLGGHGPSLIPKE